MDVGPTSPSNTSIQFTTIFSNSIPEPFPLVITTTTTTASTSASTITEATYPPAAMEYLPDPGPPYSIDCEMPSETPFLPFSDATKKTTRSGDSSIDSTIAPFATTSWPAGAQYDQNTNPSTTQCVSSTKPQRNQSCSSSPDLSCCRRVWDPKQTEITYPWPSWWSTRYVGDQTFRTISSSSTFPVSEQSTRTSPTTLPVTQTVQVSQPSDPANAAETNPPNAAPVVAGVAGVAVLAFVACLVALVVFWKYDSLRCCRRKVGAGDRSRRGDTEAAMGATLQSFAMDGRAQETGMGEGCVHEMHEPAVASQRDQGLNLETGRESQDIGLRNQRATSM